MADELERIAKALESIARNLAKFANPPMMADDKGYVSLVPGIIQWVPDRFSNSLKDETNG